MSNLSTIADDLAGRAIDSLNAAYAKRTKNKDDEWLMEYLFSGYEQMASKTSIKTKKHEWLPYAKATFIMDCVVFSVAAVYEEEIKRLKREINGLKQAASDKNPN